MIRLTRVEQQELFSELLLVSVRAAALAGLIAGGVYGTILAIVDSCIAGAPLAMIIVGLGGAAFGCLLGLVIGLIVGTEACGCFTPLYSKRRLGWVVTSQSFVVVLTVVLLCMRLMGILTDVLHDASQWATVAGLSVFIWLWTSHRITVRYGDYIDRLTAVAAAEPDQTPPQPET